MPHRNDYVGIFLNRFTVLLEIWGAAFSLTSLAVFPWHVIVVWVLAFAHK